MINLLNLPKELLEIIASYLDSKSLYFFAQTNRKSLWNVLGVLKKCHQALLRPPTLTIKAVSASFCYTTNSIYACGNNGYGQFGLGHKNICTTFTKLPTLPGAILQVVHGEYHVLILTEQGLYGCGRNNYGQLGLEHTSDYTSFKKIATPAGKIQQVVTGYSHTLLLINEELFVCGMNNVGQLGLKHTEKCISFTKITSLTGTIQQVVAGAYHTLILTDEGLYACGANSYGQLGLGLKNSYCTTFTKVVAPPGVIKQVVAGKDHTLILTDKGLFGCGRSDLGQLGIGQRTNCEIFTKIITPAGKIQQVVAGYSHTLLLVDKELYACGTNHLGQLGLIRPKKDPVTFTRVARPPGVNDECMTFTKIPTPPGTIQQVVAGAYHNIVLTDQGLFACGWNEHSQLGLGDTKECDTFMRIVQVPTDIHQYYAYYKQLGELISLAETKNIAPQLIEQQNSKHMSFSNTH